MHPPLQMGIGVWYATCTNAHRPHDRKHEQQAGAAMMTTQTMKYDTTKCIGITAPTSYFSFGSACAVRVLHMVL